MPVRIAVDIGGTFTDIVLCEADGTVRTMKVFSTPSDYALGVIDGIVRILSEHKVEPIEVERVVHASTVASNAVLEGKGALTALLTTRGFRDVLEMRRLRIPVMYDLQYAMPKPLVRRALRFEISERLGPTGEVIRSLVESDVRDAALKACSKGVSSIAIAFLHSYANDAHERRAAEIVREHVGGDDVFICTSSQLLAEIREYERTSTAVVNAYVGPVVSEYITSLESRLKEIGIPAQLEIMHSGGGIISASDAVKRPAHLVESGPAAGVMAGAFIAREIGAQQMITFDMGGTTAKTAILENGTPVTTAEYEVGAGINLSSRLVKGGGHAIRLPFIDLSEIGAGGGSLVSVDEFKMLHVGPKSAGANPGPVCYGKGGTIPTLTDALVVLGYLNPHAIAGGSVEIHQSKAVQAIDEVVATPLGRSSVDAAFGIFELAVATMTRAVKAVSTYRGRDPRDFVLCAFGGNGPVAAAAIAEALRMRRVLIPPASGVFSAVGLLLSDIQHEFLQTLFVKAIPENMRKIQRAFDDLQEEASVALNGSASTGSEITLRRFADIRYTGQAYELTIPIDDAHDLDALIGAFHAEHARTYGHAALHGQIDIVNVKLAATISRAATIRSVAMETAPKFKENAPTRQAYFGSRYGIAEAPVIARAELTESPRRGPFIVEDYDSTCVVPPYCHAVIDQRQTIELHLES